MRNDAHGNTEKRRLFVNHSSTDGNVVYSMGSCTEKPRVEFLSPGLLLRVGFIREKEILYSSFRRQVRSTCDCIG
jgi:hypothetical protein